MKKYFKMLFKSIVYSMLLLMPIASVAMPDTVLAAPDTVNLKSTSNFAILAGSTITNTGTTSISGSAGGDIGLHPGDDETMETFPGQASVTLSGAVHLFDAVAQQAKTDLVTVYNDAKGRTSTETIAADLEGRTLLPGVYTSGSSILVSGKLILDADNDPNAVFIFQAGSSLTTASNSSIELINGAQSCNVFWQVGSSATLGTNSTFIGHIFAMESITATTGALIYGQLLAIDGAVTLDSNIIRNEACNTGGSLSVQKIVDGSPASSTQKSFEITITGPNEYTDTQLIDAGATYTWVGLASGVYTIEEEKLNDQWTVEGTGEYEVSLGEVTEVTITNTYEGSDRVDLEELPNTSESTRLWMYAGFMMLASGFFILQKTKK